MTTQSAFLQSGSSGLGLCVGVAAFLSKLMREPDIAVSLQRARAKRQLSDLNDQLLSGRIRSQQVEELTRSVQGRTLQRLPHGTALLSLLNATALAREREWVRALEAVSPAAQDPLTAPYAVCIKAVAFEYQGDFSSSDENLKIASNDGLLENTYIALVVINVEKGIDALEEGDSKSIEISVDRIIYLDRRARERGFTHLVDSAFKAAEMWLSGNFEGVLSYFRQGNVDRDTKNLAHQSMNAELERFQAQTLVKAAYHLKGLREMVQLMSVGNPFERWRELSNLVSSDWPDELTAEHAVREGRE